MMSWNLVVDPRERMYIELALPGDSLCAFTMQPSTKLAPSGRLSTAHKPIDVLRTGTSTGYTPLKAKIR